jgi:hypothetical protein
MCARSLGIAFAEGVEKFFWYEFRDSETDPFDAESFFGLVRRDSSAKAALRAYRTFIDMRPPGSVQLRRDWRSADGVWYPQWLRPDGRSAGMIWTPGRSGKRAVVFSAEGVEIFNVLGERMRVPSRGRSVELPVTGSPVYFVGATLERSGLM